jgi:hypothetical protein
MLNKRRFYLKWTSIVIAYLCIFLLSYQFGSSRYFLANDQIVYESRQHLIEQIFHEHIEFLNSSMIYQMINEEIKHPLLLVNVNRTRHETQRIVRHGLVVFYDFSYHHVFFQQFLWLYSSWCQLTSMSNIHNDLIVFVSSATIPHEFQTLIDQCRQQDKQLKIYSCPSIVDTIVTDHTRLPVNFSLPFLLELTRLFYWQQTRLSSLLLFLVDSCQDKLLDYDFIFRLDFDSFLMPTFDSYEQISSLTFAQPIVHDTYTLNRLERIRNSFSLSSTKHIREQTMTICWFGRLHIFQQLIRRIVLVALWLIKEEFTESERLHHLTYLNYPSWYLDGIFEYAASIVLSLNNQRTDVSHLRSSFDCQQYLNGCRHVSLRDPSQHLHLNKHSLLHLTEINRSNLTKDEFYIYRTVIESNRMFRLRFESIVSS